VFSFGVTDPVNYASLILLPLLPPVEMKDLTLDASAAHPAFSSAVTGYFQASDQSKHVFFIDKSAHVHGMYLNAGAAHWVEPKPDLTTIARPRGIAAMPGSPLAAYVQYSNNSQHVNFVDGNGHLRELRYDSTYRYWANSDLTLIGCSATATTAPSKNLISTAALITPGSGINSGPTCNPVPPPLPGSAIDAYWDPSDDSQHVNFMAKGSDGNVHVHELYASPNQFWLDTDLTVASQQSSSVICFLCDAPPAVLPNALHGYSVGSSNGQQHVNYIDSNGDVHELYGTGNSWSDNILTAGTSSRASATSALAGYWGETDDQQHVIFVGRDGHVHELFHGSGWPEWQRQDIDLTVKSNELTSTGSLGGVISDALIGYWEQIDNSQHIYSLTTDGHAHHLHWDGARWSDEDLSHLQSCTQAVQSAVPGALSAYKSTDNGYEAITIIGKPQANPAEVDVFQMYARSAGSECP
jgi:hypothetical protein